MKAKLCLQCGNLHLKSGTFCCRSCASKNRGPRSLTTKKKISEGLKKNAKERSPKQLKAARAAGIKAAAAWKQQSLHRMLTAAVETLSREALRQRLLIEQKGVCKNCANPPIWMGKSITLEIDHIDGNRQNKKRENLRLLCPNCHAQTPTFRKAKQHPKWSSRQDSNLQPPM